MLTKVQKGLVDQLFLGTLDKNGKDHDEAKRACLFVMNTILSYIPSIYAEYDQLQKDKEKREALASKAGIHIHGDDYIRTQLDNL